MFYRVQAQVSVVERESTAKQKVDFPFFHYVWVRASVNKYVSVSLRMTVTQNVVESPFSLTVFSLWLCLCTCMCICVHMHGCACIRSMRYMSAVWLLVAIVYRAQSFCQGIQWEFCYGFNSSRIWPKVYNFAKCSEPCTKCHTSQVGR